MASLERTVTGIEAQVCPRCIELTTRVVALEHELYELKKRLQAYEPDGASGGFKPVEESREASKGTDAGLEVDNDV